MWAYLSKQYGRQKQSNKGIKRLGLKRRDKKDEEVLRKNLFTS